MLYMILIYSPRENFDLDAVLRINSPATSMQLDKYQHFTQGIQP